MKNLLKRIMNLLFGTPIELTEETKQIMEDLRTGKLVVKRDPYGRIWLERYLTPEDLEQIEDFRRRLSKFTK